MKSGVWIVGLPGLLLLMSSCGRETIGPADGPVVGLRLDVVPVDCISVGPDGDADELADRCERMLAAAFAPSLVVQPVACDWDETVEPARLGGEYYYAAAWGPERGSARIVYMPAYYRDCGWSGFKCRVPGVRCGPHAGDSELVMLEVEFDPESNRWKTVGVFLSAHCFGKTGGDCRWYRAGDLSAFHWLDGKAQGAPVIWVSEGRHANYPSQSACDRGHYYLDTCDRNETRFRFPVERDRQNIRSRAMPAGDPGGCVDRTHAGWDSQLTVPGAMECFWSDVPFRGWQGGAGGATSYSRYLREIAGL